MTELEKQERYQKLVAEAKASVDGLIEFDGMNCDDCPGWDGESRRCECGTRRVSWEPNDDYSAVYAVAW